MSLRSGVRLSLIRIRYESIHGRSDAAIHAAYDPDQTEPDSFSAVVLQDSSGVWSHSRKSGLQGGFCAPGTDKSLIPPQAFTVCFSGNGCRVSNDLH